MNNECQSPQENNVSECLPKKFDRKAYEKAYRELNKEKISKTEKAYRELNKEKISKTKKAYRELNKEKLKAHRELNKEKILENKKAYREANKEKLKAYREANKEKILEYNKAYYEANKEKLKAYYEDNKEKLKAYYEANKEKIIEVNILYKKKRLKEDPLFAAKHKLRKCVYQSFKRIAKNKPTDTQTLLGCSWQEAREHFERMFKEGMTWENHGKWHIDHIRPVSSFSENELHLMNLISNLQPLWGNENLSKNNKYKKME